MDDTSFNNMKTRFAPSPTGNLHIGSARTALFNYLAAKHYGGEMYLRIEDTDKERSREEYEKNILAGLSWLGIEYDGKIVYQSTRHEIYEKYIKQLIADGHAYESEEERDGEKSTVIRFKNKGEDVTFNDIIRGEITMNTADLGDFVIAKDVRTPLYHLAVVVDDHEMGITHIIRGEDHISNTPRQILIGRALSAKMPLYAHLPLVLGPDRSKLSKRHGATGVDEFEKDGYLPEALMNFMAFLGWSPDEKIRQEKDDVFLPAELIEHFTLPAIGKGGAIFDYQKLKWLNRKYIKNLTDEAWEKKIKEELPSSITILPHYKEKVIKLKDILTEYLDTFADVKELYKEGALSYFFIEPTYTVDALLWKDEHNKEKTAERLEKVISYLDEIPEDLFTHEKIKETIWDYASEEGRGAVLWPMRYGLSGQQKSPDPFVLSEFFGKKETQERLLRAVKQLRNA